MEVHASAYLKVDINPVHVVEQINIIDRGDWIIEKKGKFIQMTEESAGQHSFDHAVGEVSAKTYELYKAKELLLQYLKTIYK